MQIHKHKYMKYIKTEYFTGDHRHTADSTGTLTILTNAERCQKYRPAEISIVCKFMNKNRKKKRREIMKPLEVVAKMDTNGIDSTFGLTI